MATVIELVKRPLQLAPFQQWEYGDAEKALHSLLTKGYQTRWKYAIDFDHFQGGKEWVGPGMPEDSPKIAEQFAPDDVVGEVLSNVANAFAEPQLGAMGIEELDKNADIPVEVQNKINELLAALTVWWDKQRLHELVQNRQFTTAWAGRGGLRLWIPWRFLQRSDDGEIEIRATANFAEALSFIHVSAPQPHVGGVYTDPLTQEKVAIYLDEEKDGDATVKRAELIYLDPNRERDEEAETIIRVIYSDPNKGEKITRINLNGRLLFAEMRGRALLTDPVLRTQRQLNLVTSLLNRMVETAAFRERYIQNAEPQGMRYPYEDGAEIPAGAFLKRDEEGRAWVIVPQPRTLGANTTTELVGLPTMDERGENQRTYVHPGVHIEEPVDPGPYLKAANEVRARILRMCGQGHLGGSSNAEVSGIAYEQARAVFEKDLDKRRVSEEGMLRDLLSVLIIMAEEISGKRGYFSKVLRVTVDQFVNAGPRSPDLVRLDMEGYENGILSEDTVMTRFGVEDIEAEKARIHRNREHVLAILEQATRVKDIVDIKKVLRHLGLPNQIVNAVLDEPEPLPPPPPQEDGPPIPPPVEE
jgi:hypothetical protein